MKSPSPRVKMLIAYLDGLAKTGKADTPNTDFDRALTAALNALEVPFRRTVYGGGYIIELEED